MTVNSGNMSSLLFLRGLVINAAVKQLLAERSQSHDVHEQRFQSCVFQKLHSSQSGQNNCQKIISHPDVIFSSHTSNICRPETSA